MTHSSPQTRRNLVVVRAGKNSLHQRWLNAGANRSWDLVVSLYDPAAHFDHSEDVVTVVRPGGKWDGLHAFFADSDVLSRYDYVWLPDDDIDARSSNIDAIFEAMRRWRLDVAQPALTRDSYFTHFVVMACPGFTLRYVNFVEIMVPCLSSDLLARMLEDFRDSMSGFGLDYVWCRQWDDNRRRAAILDEVTVRHTRPIGGVLRHLLTAGGRSADEEERLLCRRWGAKEKARPLVYAAIDADGRLREGRARLGLTMAWRYLSVRGQFGAHVNLRAKTWQLLRRQLTRRVDLSRLARQAEAEAQTTAFEVE